MNSFSELLQKQNKSQLILVILFIIYLVMGYPTPQPIASIIDTIFGKMVLFILAIYMFMNTNTILAVLFVFVVFDLIRRSSIATGSDGLVKYMPCEDKKSSHFNAFNQFPYTLEEEVVSKMAPLVQSGMSLTKATFKPKLNDLHDASPVNFTN
jgi:hypothetical protein